MNWVDLTVLIILIFFTIEGLGRSFLFELFDLIGFAGSLFLSLRFYNLFAKQLENYFSLPHSLGNVLGFISTWFVVETVMFGLGHFLLTKIHHYVKLPGEYLLSAVPSFFRGLIFVSLLLVLTATFPIQPNFKKSVNESRLGSAILSQTYRLESPLKNIFGGLANDTLTFLTVEPKTNESVGLGFRTDQLFYDERLESAMIDLVNKERVTRGIQPLKYDSRLRAVGRLHSVDMFKRGYFSHYSPEGKSVADRAETAGISYLVIGENLAYAPSLELAHQGLMNSPGHKTNILSTDYHNIGIGVANGHEFGLMFTQVFKD